jgi:hypothetical protein
MKHKVEPLFGWLFIAVVIVGLAAIFHVAMKPVPNRIHASKPISLTQ